MTSELLPAQTDSKELVTELVYQCWHFFPGGFCKPLPWDAQHNTMVTTGTYEALDLDRSLQWGSPINIVSRVPLQSVRSVGMVTIFRGDGRQILFTGPIPNVKLGV